MNSIKKKLLISYLIIITIMGALLVLMATFDYSLVNQYERISNNIVLEQSLSDLAGGLPEDSYNGFKSNDLSKYEKRLQAIRDVEKNLDARFNGNEESRVAYRGAKNSLDTIVTDIKETKEKLDQGGDIAGISELYKEVTNKFEYVKQNIDTLILTETKNLANVTKDLRRNRTITTYVLVLITLFGALGTTLYAVIFSGKLTQPIVTLSETASRIADGDLTLNVKTSLLNQRDEIGSLSVSFDSMVHKLRAKFEELQTSQAQLERSKHDIEQRNEELERFNKLVVDRELKMVELKNRIAELEAAQKM